MKRMKRIRDSASSFPDGMLVEGERGDEATGEEGDPDADGDADRREADAGPDDQSEHVSDLGA